MPVAKAATKSIIGGDWPSYLEYSIELKRKGKLNHSVNIRDKENYTPP